MSLPLYHLVGIISLSVCSLPAVAQTKTFYGRPATIHSNGDVECADNDRVCMRISKEDEQANRSSALLPTIQGSLDVASNTTPVTVTAYTANGPLTFQALPVMQAADTKLGRSVYRFHKVSRMHRVVIQD